MIVKIQESHHILLIILHAFAFITLTNIKIFEQKKFTIFIKYASDYVLGQTKIGPKSKVPSSMLVFIVLNEIV